jgi:hypothetical protein
MDIVSLTKKMMIIFVFFELMIGFISYYLGSVPIQNPAINSLNNINSNTTIALNNIGSAFNQQPYNNTGTFGFLSPVANFISDLGFFIGNFFSYVFNIVYIIVFMLTMFLPEVLASYNMATLGAIVQYITIAVNIAIAIWIFKWVYNLVAGII